MNCMRTKLIFFQDLGLYWLLSLVIRAQFQHKAVLSRKTPENSAKQLPVLSKTLVGHHGCNNVNLMDSQCWQVYIDNQIFYRQVFMLYMLYEIRHWCHKFRSYFCLRQIGIVPNIPGELSWLVFLSYLFSRLLTTCTI